MHACSSTALLDVGSYDHVCVVPAAAGVTVPPPGVEAPLPWVDPHAAPDRRQGPEEHQGTVQRCSCGLMSPTSVTPLFLLAMLLTLPACGSC